MSSTLDHKQIAELRTLSRLSDETIDYSDIPPLPDAFWQDALRNPFYQPLKQAATVRIDADVLAWLRAGGKGYQNRINAILRAAMINEITKEQK